MIFLGAVVATGLLGHKQDRQGESFTFAVCLRWFLTTKPHPVAWWLNAAPNTGRPNPRPCGGAMGATSSCEKLMGEEEEQGSI